MSLNVKIRVKEEMILATVDGEMDEHTTIDLKNNILEILSKYNIKNVIFDFQFLKFMDSTGIGLLLTLHNRLKLKGSIYIVNSNENISKIVKLTGLYKICEERDSFEEVLDILGVA